MPPLRTLLLLPHAAILLMPSLLAAQQLPPPSRTMYKCTVQGTTSYSDTPCPGATRMEVEPTRGVGKLSGKERTGHDIVMERQHEALGEALRPLSGMDTKQWTRFSRRAQLTPATRRECGELDRSMAAAEDDERRAAPAQLHQVQERLYLMRQRFHDLRC